MEHSTRAKKESHKEKRYMAGLDGLRALAVFAVIAYHLQVGWAPGGLLGVCVFFVLSGYLITDILAEQWRQHRRLDLKDFWMRRVKRLLPAMFAMIAGVLAWVTIFHRAQLPSVREDAMASVLYVMNWWFVYHKVSYFESFGPPSPLGHLWSLAVEEQFYLLWPILFALLLGFLKRRGRILLILFFGIAASALAMAFVYVPGIDPSRVYYGTDTRAFALLIGAALALIWPSRRLSANLSLRARAALDLTGIAALLAIGYMVVKTSEYDAFLYRGGMVILALAAAAAIAVLAHPASLLARVLGCKPMKWLGLRSYGIYLWHYPVILFTSPTLQSGNLDPTRAVLQVAATIALAALSWRLVEEPIRHGALRNIWLRMLTGPSKPTLKSGRLWITSTCALAILIVVGGGTSAFSPFKDASVVSVAGVTPSSGGLVSPPTPLPAPTPAPSSEEQTSPTPHPTSTPTEPTPTPSTNAGSSAANANDGRTSDTGAGITVIGDSVILDAEPYLQKLLPGIKVEGKVGRQMTQAAELINQLKADGKLGNRIIIELGTNGAFPKKQLDSLLASLSGMQQVILVNTRVPRPWEDEVNSTLASAASACSNVTLVDWHSASKDLSQLFYDDGVHLNADGSSFYADLLAKSVKPAASRSGS